MANTRSISTTLVYFLGFLLLVQNQLSHASNEVKWEVHWEYEPKCEKTKDEQLNVDCMKMNMDDSNTVNLTISNLNTTDLIKSIRVVSSDSDLLKATKEIPVGEITNGAWTGSFKAQSNFIGKTDIYVEVIRTNDDTKSEQSSKLLVVIIREKRFIDHAFIVSVISLASMLYINFGAALDLRKVKSVLRRPIGPVIALFCHFVFLPLVSDNFIYFVSTKELIY